ncbi:MAG: ATP-dependent RNA helicase RhlB [Pseudomonadota bacterium]
MSKRHLTETYLASFDFPEPVQRGIKDAGFSECTPIQAQTLPLALAGQDVAGQAQTGTGKTAAYLLAAMTHLLRRPPHAGKSPRALIIAPTRELAVQIHKDAELLGKHTGLRLALVYGGAGYDTQRKQLEEGVDIVIGTPGRLIDYHKQHVFDLREVEVVVVDEADRMFDLGFIKDIRYMLRRMPKPEKRLSMLFSATLSFRVTELAYEHMNNPQLVKIETDKITGERIQELTYYPANEEKMPLLIGLLRAMDATRTMLFVNTKRTAEDVHAYLGCNGFPAAMLSGDVPQKKRLQFLSQFEQGEIPILVATDVAARGLHIPGVTHVINFDLPQDAEDYVHRIGRTARAGASGDAISFVCETYAFSLPEIEKYIGHPIPSAPVDSTLLAEISRPAHTPRHRPDPPRRGGGESGGRDQRPRRGRSSRGPKAGARPG